MQLGAIAARNRPINAARITSVLNQLVNVTHLEHLVAKPVSLPDITMKHFVDDAQTLSSIKYFFLAIDWLGRERRSVNDPADQFNSVRVNLVPAVKKIDMFSVSQLLQA